MMKFILKASLACGLLVGIAYGETDYPSSKKISDIQHGRDTRHQIDDLRVRDDAVIGDDLTVGGTVSATEGVAGPVVATTLSASSTTTLAGATTITNAVLILRDLPTTTNGLAVGSGRVWNNSGVPTIR